MPVAHLHCFCYLQYIKQVWFWLILTLVFSYMLVEAFHCVFRLNFYAFYFLINKIKLIRNQDTSNTLGKISFSFGSNIFLQKAHGVTEKIFAVDSFIN